MKETRFSIGFRPILLSILFLALGFLALWLTKNVLKIEQDVVLACVAVIPILVYLIFSGRLSEVSLPGGTSLKLFEALQRPLSTENKFNTKQVEVEEAYVIEKKEVELLERRPPDDYAKYIMLTMVLGRRTYYDNEAILKYLKVLSQFRNFKFLVILDDDGKVFAYMFVWQARQFLEKEVQRHRDDFAEFINNGYKQGLMRRYELISETVRTTDTNMTALEKMARLKTDAIVVTDENNMLKGVVEREQIISEFILAIAKSNT